MSSSKDNPDNPTPPAPPPRAFTQGVGTVFQFAGVILFLVSFFVCCASSLLSRDRATQTSWIGIGWSVRGAVWYSAQQALTISLLAGVFFGLATAGIGLGLQAQNRRAPLIAVSLTLLAVMFWIVHAIFFATTVRSVLISAAEFVLWAVFTILFLLALAAWREMRQNPTPVGFEVLPADYIVPYSHMHQDSPEVRLAREVEQRRERLALQQKELDMLEERLARKLQQKKD